MAKRTTTTKDVGLLHQLYQSGQLNLVPGYQRNSVWPRAAKVYLLDSILRDRPIPPLLVKRTSATLGGRITYEVIDGQQRLRTVFDYLDGRFRLGDQAGPSRSGKKFQTLEPVDQGQILNYDFVVEELSEYNEEDIKDIFVRFNRFVVSLNSAEIRNARETGAFANFVEEVGLWTYWADNRILSAAQLQRHRSTEFAAELVILLMEGPQDKKASIDLWYQTFRAEFPEAEEVRERLRGYQEWISNALPSLAETRFRRPVDYYSLISAIDMISLAAGGVDELDPESSGKRLVEFDAECADGTADGDVARYLAAASRQTDNIKPRETRREILARRILTRFEVPSE
ncbi:DUF262 domain-containing protein [Kineococcus rhizosphaerae]|uniref:DUF262 domain-containing protein n=1 Tax=Kineococcus rhizosphaerae TaxID=559628 RepID=UPI0014726CC1|nr:DUF262 domain-containing protein [Kineococcus rhizosphaerae]